jgi:hypothetical protein
MVMKTKSWSEAAEEFAAFAAVALVLILLWAMSMFFSG